MPFHPYLFFGGNCREAFTRYQEIFGGELTVIGMEDAAFRPADPAGQGRLRPPRRPCVRRPPADGSDDPMSEKFGPVPGMMISFSTPDVGEAKRVYDALAEGGGRCVALTDTMCS